MCYASYLDEKTFANAVLIVLTFFFLGSSFSLLVVSAELFDEGELL